MKYFVAAGLTVVFLAGLISGLAIAWFLKVFGDNDSNP